MRVLAINLRTAFGGAARAGSPALAILAIIAALAGPATASAFRIDLNKANRAKSPVEYTVAITESHGLLNVRIELPRAQKELAHLWRVDVVLSKGAKTHLSSHLDLEESGGVLSANVLVDKTTLRSTTIWIRVGEHAPLAETIYVVDLASYR